MEGSVGENRAAQRFSEMLRLIKPDQPLPDIEIDEKTDNVKKCMLE